MFLPVFLFSFVSNGTLQRFEQKPSEKNLKVVFTKHLLSKASDPVNIRGNEKTRLQKLYKTEGASKLAKQPKLFDNVRLELEKVMELDLYPGFCRKAMADKKR